MRWLSPLVVLASLMACGGSAPPPPAVAPQSPASATSSASAGAPAQASARAASSDAPQKPTMDSQREGFIHGCLKKVPAPDYCQCGFEQFAQIFKDADLSANIPQGDPRFAQLQQQTMTLCGSKLPEPTVKDSFLQGCVGGDTRKNTYCQCAWPVMRKTLSLADFLGEFQGDRFVDAERAVTKACRGKFPVEVAKSEFVGACTKGDPTSTKTCTCLWDKVRAKFSTEEIAAGLADLKLVTGLEACHN